MDIAKVLFYFIFFFALPYTVVHITYTLTSELESKVARFLLGVSALLAVYDLIFFELALTNESRATEFFFFLSFIYSLIDIFKWLSHWLTGKPYVSLLDEFINSPVQPRRYNSYHSYKNKYTDPNRGVPLDGYRNGPSGFGYYAGDVRIDIDRDYHHNSSFDRHW
ncbi:MAG: hypothetical protein ACPL7K_00805 [Armatimonadota bacterium]